MNYKRFSGGFARRTRSDLSKTGSAGTLKYGLKTIRTEPDNPFRSQEHHIVTGAPRAHKPPQVTNTCEAAVTPNGRQTGRRPGSARVPGRVVRERVDWTERLNGRPQRLALEDSVVHILNWSYAAHLSDNRPHRHAHFEVCQVGSYGCGRFLVEGRPHELGPGDVFIARPGVVHQIVNTAAPEMELFWVSFLWLPEVRPSGSSLPAGEVRALFSSFAGSPALVVADEGERIGLLWQALRALARGGLRPAAEPQLEGLMTTLLLAIAQAGSKLKVPPERPNAVSRGAAKVQLALRYVHDNLCRRVPVSELAAQMNLSPRQLARLFSCHLGISPAAYIERARLDRAKALLKGMGTPIKEVAGAVGYESVHHFSRAFSRHFGLPPGAFREAVLERAVNLKEVPKSQKRGG